MWQKNVSKWIVEFQAGPKGKSLLARLLNMQFIKVGMSAINLTCISAFPDTPLLSILYSSPVHQSVFRLFTPLMLVYFKGNMPRPLIKIKYLYLNKLHFTIIKWVKYIILIRNRID